VTTKRLGFETPGKRSLRGPALIACRTGARFLNRFTLSGLLELSINSAAIEVYASAIVGVVTVTGGEVTATATALRLIVGRAGVTGGVKV
jgi:hypothetical protein